MNIEELLETIKDTSRDYVGINGCLYQDISREELDLIVNEIERLNNIINELEKYCNEVIEETKSFTNTWDRAERKAIEQVLNKLKELKENK